MNEVESRRHLDDIQLGVAVPHQRDAKDHGIRRAHRGAERQQERAEIHVAKRFPLPHLDRPHLFRERLEGVIGVGQSRDHPATDLALMAGEAAHRPAARRIDHILQRPGQG